MFSIKQSSLCSVGIYRLCVIVLISTHLISLFVFLSVFVKPRHHLSSSLLLQALPATMELPGSGEVFDDGENPPSSRSSESGFTDFIQYQGDGTEETEQTPHPHPATKAGHRSSSGPSHTKPLDKPVMQCCLEHFQQFLSRLTTLYITPKQAVKAGGERGEVMQPGPLVSEGCQHSDHTESCSGSGLVQRDCVAAFTAACQLCLECSSFPVYIAEGNLKSSSTQEEQFGKCLKCSL